MKEKIIEICARNKITSKISEFFCKVKGVFRKNEIEIIDEPKKEIKEEIREEIKQQTSVTNDEEKKAFVKLVQKFDNNEIEEKDLTLKEKEQLTKYYENKNKELDMQIEQQRKILVNLSSKINI